MHRRIFAVGDSHSQRCFENHAKIADSTVLFGHNKLDGKTAYNLPRHDKKIRKIREAVPDRHLIFCFGEVDIRIHIKYKHQQTGQPIGAMLSNTADRYTAYVASLRRQGHNIHVFNVIPTGNFSTPEAQLWKETLCYPFLASRSERTAYTETFNRDLAVYCDKRNIPFIDIYKHLVDENGQRKKELIYDYSHLNNTIADLVLEHHSFV
jgi:lysophospholipase L1-like esterase